MDETSTFVKCVDVRGEEFAGGSDASGEPRKNRGVTSNEFRWAGGKEFL